MTSYAAVNIVYTCSGHTSAYYDKLYAADNIVYTCSEHRSDYGNSVII